MAKRNANIPTASRTKLRARDQACQRCWSPASDYHHRRTRSVIDDHTSCGCVAILLCRLCHSWVHSNVDESTKLGFIVSRYIDEPATIPVNAIFGWRYQHCDWTTTPAVTPKEKL